MILKLSQHAKTKHQNEQWNAVTIREAYNAGKLSGVEFLPGKTADILCGNVDDVFVGLVLSKPVLGVHVIITGFAAPLEYWKTV